MSTYTPAHGAGRETIRFRGPTKPPQLDANGDAMKPKRWIDRHTGLMVDLLRRYVLLACFLCSTDLTPSRFLHHTLATSSSVILSCFRPCSCTFSDHPLLWATHTNRPPLLLAFASPPSSRLQISPTSLDAVPLTRFPNPHLPPIHSGNVHRHH